MILKEEKRDLFSVGDDYYFAHCISQDFALGAGIAVEFNKRYNMAERLKQQNYFTYVCSQFAGSKCLQIDNVYNLVTKFKCYNKPTYETLRKALVMMRLNVVCDGIQKIAMPKIGCGLDRLQWNKVKEIIEDVFKDIDIEILVCYL